jgi:hypothetical protein
VVARSMGTWGSHLCTSLAKAPSPAAAGAAAVLRWRPLAACRETAALGAALAALVWGRRCSVVSLPQPSSTWRTWWCPLVAHSGTNVALSNPSLALLLAMGRAAREPTRCIIMIAFRSLLAFKCVPNTKLVPAGAHSLYSRLAYALLRVSCPLGHQARFSRFAVCRQKSNGWFEYLPQHEISNRVFVVDSATQSKSVGHSTSKFDLSSHHTILALHQG